MKFENSASVSNTLFEILLNDKLVDSMLHSVEIHVLYQTSLNKHTVGWMYVFIYNKLVETIILFQNSRTFRTLS